MKKLLAMILIFVCMTAFAAAETDLSSMSYDELMQLQKDVVFEIMSRPEWKQVTVPGGTWIVGKDIPAGSYSISPGEKGGYITIKRPGEKFSIISQGIRKESSRIGKIDLINGDSVLIDDGSLIFAPAIGLEF